MKEPERTNETTGIYAQHCVALAEELGLRSINLWSKMQETDDWQKKYLRSIIWFVETLSSPRSLSFCFLLNGSSCSLFLGCKQWWTPSHAWRQWSCLWRSFKSVQRSLALSWRNAFWFPSPFSDRRWQPIQSFPRALLIRDLIDYSSSFVFLCHVFITPTHLYSLIFSCFKMIYNFFQKNICFTIHFLHF